MVQMNHVYKCNVCGNIVEVVHASLGQLKCCGQPMRLQKENTIDAAEEKHVPVVEKSNGSVTVKIGNVAHPMEQNHYIQFIELLAYGRVYRKSLKPGDTPEATFEMAAENVVARAYCNQHGLWQA